ncbi:MAG: hypothetical protein C4337_01605 [Armatimonadota bacterium]
MELDYEYMLLFRKPGRSSSPVEAKNVSLDKEASALMHDEWKQYFCGRWKIAGERQTHHEAMFPEAIPLIRMFSFVGETVLDPFAGSSTTLKVARDLQRNAIGYEIQPDFVPLIAQKLGGGGLFGEVQIVRREVPVPPVDPPAYQPQIKDTRPLVDPQKVIPFQRMCT